MGKGHCRKLTTMADSSRSIGLFTNVEKLSCAKLLIRRPYYSHVDKNVDKTLLLGAPNKTDFIDVKSMVYNFAT